MRKSGVWLVIFVLLMLTACGSGQPDWYPIEASPFDQNAPSRSDLFYVEADATRGGVWLGNGFGEKGIYFLSGADSLSGLKRSFESILFPAEYNFGDNVRICDLCVSPQRDAVWVVLDTGETSGEMVLRYFPDEKRWEAPWQKTVYRCEVLSDGSVLFTDSSTKGAWRYKDEVFSKIAFDGKTRDISLDGHGNLWLASTGNTIYRLDTSNQWVEQTRMPAGVKVLDLFFAGQPEALWIDSEEVLYRWQPDSGTGPEQITNLPDLSQADDNDLGEWRLGSYRSADDTIWLVRGNGILTLKQGVFDAVPLPGGVKLVYDSAFDERKQILYILSFEGLFGLRVGER